METQSEAGRTVEATETAGCVCGVTWALKWDCLVGILTQPLSGCATMGKLLNLSSLHGLVL